MGDADLQRDLGRLEGKVEELAKAVDRAAAKLEETNRSVVAISGTLSEARGGWRILMLVAGVAGSIGSALTWLASYLHLPRP